MRALRLAVLLLALALAPVAAQSADPLTPEQKQAVEAMIRDTLAQHPEIVIDALKEAERQDDAAAAERTRRAIAGESAALFADPAAPVGGNEAGDVTVVEFFDYSCPYCKAIEPDLEALLSSDRKLRIVYKEFPILGPSSLYAARVALAAAAEGKYGTFHRAMMAVKGKIDDDAVRRVAAASGLDMARLDAATAASGIDRAIQANYALARTLEVEGTPVFIVGGEMLPGIDDIATLRAAIARARKG